MNSGLIETQNNVFRQAYICVTKGLWEFETRTKRWFNIRRCYFSV